MSSNREHLGLNISPKDYNRKKHGGGGYKIRTTGKPEFISAEIRSLEGLETVYAEQKQRHPDHNEPGMIFKVNLNQPVFDEKFRADLSKTGIETIEAAPEKGGDWIVYAENANVEQLKISLKENIDRQKANFVDAIKAIKPISKNDKIGGRLKKSPFSEDELGYVDVEIWRLNDEALNFLLSQIDTIIQSKGGKIVDKITTKNFALLRIQTNKPLLEELIEMQGIARVDRPPELTFGQYLGSDIGEFKTSGAPPADAAGIMIVDSGIRKQHPLLEGGIGDQKAIATKDGKIVDGNAFDDAGHGTAVAGIALYGDIKERADSDTFKPAIWIYPAKVLYVNDHGIAVGNPEELVENQLRKAVDWIVENHPNCKIVNLSLGNSENRMYGPKHQFTLATLIDELCEKHGLTFVISAGNNFEDGEDPSKYPNNYPHYLLADNEEVKILDPASSALALTVGAVYRRPLDGKGFSDYMPSPITRVGPGFRGMIKPELVEDGGGGRATGIGVLLVDPFWLDNGRLFTLSHGTSYSAPKVSHMLASLMNSPSLKNSSQNMLKALLLASATIPAERPEPLASIEISDPFDQSKALFNVYGYGKPDLNKALYSSDNRVVLRFDGKIALDKVHLFSIPMPEIFVTEPGLRSISVSLVFQPPISNAQSHYLALGLEAHLFKNKTIEEVAEGYTKSEVNDDAEGDIPKKLKNSEIKLFPGIKVRRIGVHQKGMRIYKASPGIDTDENLVLAVVCQNRSIKDVHYQQSYAVVVTIEHSAAVDLYSQIRLKNRPRARIK